MASRAGAAAVLLPFPGPKEDANRAERADRESAGTADGVRKGGSGA